MLLKGVYLEPILPKFLPDDTKTYEVEIELYILQIYYNICRHLIEPYILF